MIQIFTSWQGPANLFAVSFLFATCAIYFSWRKSYPAAFGWDCEQDAFWAIALIALWAIFSTFDFWSLGPSSFMSFGDEGEVSYPYFAHLAATPLAARLKFDPMVAGGADAVSLFAGGRALVSFEILLFRWFGPDHALIINKILNSFIATMGTYLLIRRGLKVRVAPSGMIAVFYSISFFYVHTVTLSHGVGYAIVPVAVYILVYCIESRHYLLCCLALAIVNAISMTLTHSFVALCSALLCAAVYRKTVLSPRFIAGSAIVVVIAALNWMDVLYGMITFVKFSERGAHAATYQGHFSVSYLVRNVFDGTLYVADTIPVLAAIILCAPQTGDRIRMGLLCLGPFLVGLVFTRVPFDALGLGALATIDPLYFALASSAIFVLALGETAKALESGPPKPLWRLRLFYSALVALDLAAFTSFKYLHFLEFIGGSSRDIFNIENVKEFARMIAPGERVVAGPDSRSSEYLSDDVLLAYGLPTLGGYFNLIDLWHNEFWRHVGQTGRGYGGLPAPPTCDQIFALDNALGLLAVSGVHYVVSRTPVSGPGLTLLSRPANDVSPRCAARGFERVRLAFAEVGRVRDAFIYKVPDALPLAYFASALAHTDYDLADGQFWAEVAQRGPRRVAVTSAALPSRDYEASGTLDSIGFDGSRYVITTTAGGDSLLVLNHPHLPFWHAAIDGASASIIDVNGIQMGVVLPPGHHTVTFLYDRWLPSDLLRRAGV